MVSVGVVPEGGADPGHRATGRPGAPLLAGMPLG
ncbi:hypothetical protein HaLaN_04584 [Haematococcus lacustris]|uniref:Uncharacterized protein n=1 Tax=Haematococcus lacustris TaxID=44745 RepID=A0A699YH63_HAELA|nr:hypothetical protein HaLaN_04584 [Haematococcus lacustris]